MVRRVRTITQTVVMPAPSDRVYDALVNARIHAAFTGAPAAGAARVGATFTAWGGYITGVHRRLVKGRSIVQDWQTSEWPEGAGVSTLAFTLTKVEGGTRVRMVHSKVPAEQADAYRQGWIDHYWTPLKAYFSEGRASAGIRRGSR